MSYPPNFVPRSKPVTYTWLSWLLKLIIPLMVLLPLFATTTSYMDLAEAPSEAKLYFTYIGEELVEIGKAKQPYVFEDSFEDFEEIPEQRNPSAQSEVFLTGHIATEAQISDTTQVNHEFEQWCYISLRSSVPIVGDAARGFLIEVPDYGFIDPEFGVVNYSVSEYQQRLDEAECQPEPVKTQYNTILYGTRFVLTLAVGFLAIFAAYSFDKKNRNPLLEYSIIILMSLLALPLMFEAVYTIPLVFAIPAFGYLFWKRDVL